MALYDGPSINSLASGSALSQDHPTPPPNALSAVNVFDRFGAEAIHDAHEKAVWKIPDGIALSEEERQPIAPKIEPRQPGMRPLPGYSRRLSTGSGISFESPSKREHIICFHINKRSWRKTFVTVITAIGIAVFLFKSERFGKSPHHPEHPPSKDALLEMKLTVNWSFVTKESKLSACKLDSADRILRLNDAEYALDPPKVFELKQRLLESIYSDIPKGPVLVNGGRPQFIAIYFGDWPFGASKLVDPKHYHSAVVPLTKLLKELGVDVSESAE